MTLCAKTMRAQCQQNRVVTGPFMTHKGMIKRSFISLKKDLTHCDVRKVCCTSEIRYTLYTTTKLNDAEYWLNIWNCNVSCTVYHCLWERQQLRATTDKSWVNQVSCCSWLKNKWLHGMWMLSAVLVHQFPSQIAINTQILKFFILLLAWTVDLSVIWDVYNE